MTESAPYSEAICRDGLREYSNEAQVDPVGPLPLPPSDYNPVGSSPDINAARVANPYSITVIEMIRNGSLPPAINRWSSLQLGGPHLP